MCEAFRGEERGSLPMHKPRAITRANAKKGKREEKLTMRNNCGYLDPTPYLALKNTERAEKSVQIK